MNYQIEYDDRCRVTHRLAMSFPLAFMTRWHPSAWLCLCTYKGTCILAKPTLCMSDRLGRSILEGR